MSRRTPTRLRLTLALATAMVLRAAPAAANSGLSSGTAAAAPEIPASLQSVVVALTAAEEVAAAAELAARRDETRSDAELARRLVAGQVLLGQRDSERAAVIFLDLLENAPTSPAGTRPDFWPVGAAFLAAMGVTVPAPGLLPVAPSAKA